MTQVVDQAHSLFLQKVPRLFDENERIEVAVRMLKKVEPEIPVYNTRAMRQKFQREIKLLNFPTPLHVVRHIYRTLTQDSSADTASQEIDETVNLAIETGGPDLVIGLRHLSKGRPGDTFDVFFRELEITSNSR